MSETRRISWFSCGVASGVASKLMLDEHPDTLIVRIVLDSELEDNSRFARDCADWFGKEIIEIRSSRYKDTWEVWEKRRYLNGPSGALCTTELKKMVRGKFQQIDDIQAFGYTSEELARANRFCVNNFEIFSRFPLIENNLSKKDCFKIIMSVGIELPLSYRMGYNNGNCIPCVKGGKGYWNKIRIDFPDRFNRMSELEQAIGRSCINGTFLKDLDPEAGRKTDLILPDCGMTCGDK